MKVNFLWINENNSMVNSQFSQVIGDGVIMTKYTHNLQFFKLPHVMFFILISANKSFSRL